MVSTHDLYWRWGLEAVPANSYFYIPLKISDLPEKGDTHTGLKPKVTGVYWSLCRVT